MKKAFTLIELLAVIIILAIVALIATPLILNVIDDAERSAQISEVNLIVSGAEQLYASTYLSDPLNLREKFDGVEQLYSYVKTSGGKPLLGDLKINSSGQVFIAVFENNVCYFKDFTDNTVAVDESKTNLEDCVPLLISFTTDKESNTGWFKEEFNLTINGNGSKIKYCESEIGVDCTDYTTEINSNTHTINFTAGSKRICAISTSDTNESKPVCKDFGIDNSTPTVVKIAESTSVAEGTTKNLEELFTITFPEVRGTVTCEIKDIDNNTLSNDTKNLGVGKYTVTCTATSLGGNSASDATNITIGNFLISGPEFNKMTGTFQNFITLFNVSFETSISDKYWDLANHVQYDVSASQDDSVVMWHDTSVSPPVVRIQANGMIYASEDMTRFFDDFDSMSEVDFTGLDTSFVTNMSYMFYRTQRLSSINFADHFDTSNVTNMKRMFYGNSYLNEIDFGEKFDTSNVIDMSGMFYSCNIRNLVFPESFNTSKVTDMTSMFALFGDYTQVDELNLSLSLNFDTSNVTSVSGMFYDSDILNINLGDKFDTSNVSNFQSMFDGSSNLVELDLGDKFSMVKSTSYNRYMFGDLYKVKKIDLGDGFDTSTLTDMSHLFYKMYELTELDLGNSFDTSNVVNLDNVFRNLPKLKVLDLGDKFSTKSATNMQQLFAECDSLEHLYLGEQFMSIRNAARMFLGINPNLKIYAIEDETFRDSMNSSFYGFPSNGEFLNLSEFPY